MPWEQLVILLLGLAIVHNRSAHGQYPRIIDVMSIWIKICAESFLSLLDERSITVHPL